jgi:hypothetical protein
MKTKLLALALLLMPACATLTKPCVEACQPGSVCVAGVCVAVTTPPPVEPPAPPVQPPVQPPVEPPAPPVVEPPPAGCTVPPLSPALLPPVLPDAAWTSDGVDQTAKLATATAAAIRKAQAACPTKWADHRCLMLGPAGINAAYDDIAGHLQAAGFVAGQGANDNNAKADHLTIQRPSDSAFEEWKLFAYTDGCLAQTQYKGAHRPRGSAADGCGEPAPPPLSHLTAHRSDIRDGWEKVDSTPQTAEGNRAYCDSVGFQNRNSCPARAEEPAWTGGDRLACERRMLRGPAPLWKWTGAGSDGYVRDGSNGFAFDHRKGSQGSLSVCDAMGEKCNVVIP